MNCFSCKKEFGVNAYVVMPLLHTASCLNCWTIGEEMYLLVVNNQVGGNNA